MITVAESSHGAGVVPVDYPCPIKVGVNEK